MPVRNAVRRFVTDLRRAWNDADLPASGPRLRDYPLRRP